MRNKNTSAREIINSSGIHFLEDAPEKKEPSKNIAGVVFSISFQEKQPIVALLYGRDVEPTKIYFGEK